MTSWISRVGAALGLDKDARSLDAALDEDSARAARGVTPIRDVTDRSHALVFGTRRRRVPSVFSSPRSTMEPTRSNCAGRAAHPSRA